MVKRETLQKIKNKRGRDSRAEAQPPLIFRWRRKHSSLPRPPRALATPRFLTIKLQQKTLRRFTITTPPPSPSEKTKLPPFLHPPTPPRSPAPAPPRSPRLCPKSWRETPGNPPEQPRESPSPIPLTNKNPNHRKTAAPKKLFLQNDLACLRSSRMKPAVKFSPLLRTSDCCDAFFLSSLQFSAFHLLPPSAPFPRNPLLPSLHSAHQLFQNPSSQTIPKANSSQC